MKILGTGLRGLVGWRVVELLQDRYEFEYSDIDITDREEIGNKIKSSSAQIVLHLAAKTDVDGCEKDKVLGENGDAWRTNVVGTKNVAYACSETNKKLIYISTDFVFDGEKESYIEEDIPNPINWYAETKYEGEKIVQGLKSQWVIVRIAYPYRANFERFDFFIAILNGFQKGERVKAVTDHIFCPTFIDDIAKTLDLLIKNNSEGIFHAVGGEALAPYDAAVKISKIFNCDESLISKTTRAEFFKDRAKRPFQLALKNDKIERLGIRMKTFKEGLLEINKQIENSKFKISNPK